MKHGPGRTVTGKKLQAPSNKPQAPSIKLQASSRKLKSFLNLNPISRSPGPMAHSYKLLNFVPWNKFQGSRTKGPKQDKCILRMGLMK